MTTRQFKFLSWLQIMITLVIIIVGTLYYTKVVSGKDSSSVISKLLWKTGFEEISNYGNYQASALVLAILLWIFKTLAITIGIVQLLIKHFSSAKKGMIIPKTKQEIFNGVLSCLSMYIIVDLVLLFSQWFLSIAYSKKIEELGENKER